MNPSRNAGTVGRADTETKMMKVISQEEYGSPDQVMAIAEVPVPSPERDELLVQVHASSVNAMEWHLSTGLPLLVRPNMGWRRPKQKTLGADVSGVVAAVGPDAEGFQPGDEVIGEIFSGAYAEYAVASERHFVAKPQGMTHEQGGSLGVAALTALQGLRDHGKLTEGQHVLIIGASGGVGSFAVPIAKALGARVTAVCSTHNVETARVNGADEVIDYQRQDFTDDDERYDLIFDGPTNLSPFIYKRLLKPGGRHIMFGGPKGKLLGPIPKAFGLRLGFLTGGKTTGMFLARVDQADLSLLARWVDQGVVDPVISATHPLDGVPEALTELGRGHSRGKAVIKVK